MRIRREIKKAWFVMKLILGIDGLSEYEKNEIKKTKIKFELKLNEIDTTKEKNEIINKRRVFLSSHHELEVIFHMFYLVIQLYRDKVTDLIKEEGYLKFNCLVQYALIGGDENIQYNEALNFAKTDYIYDIACYGPLSRECFFDILLELIEMWSDAGELSKLSIAFAWALLNSICDVFIYPPRFRLIHQVKCVSTLHESVRIDLFHFYFYFIVNFELFFLSTIAIIQTIIGIINTIFKCRGKTSTVKKKS